MKNQDHGLSMQDALQFINTPAGQQLMQLLQNSDDPAIAKAKQQAASGKMDAAREALQQLSANEELQKLLAQLGG